MTEVIDPTTGEYLDVSTDAGLAEAYRRVNAGLRELYRLLSELDSVTDERHRATLDSHREVALADDVIVRAKWTADKRACAQLRSKLLGERDYYFSLWSSSGDPTAFSKEIQSVQARLALFRDDGTVEIGKCTRLIKLVHVDPELRDFAAELKAMARKRELRTTIGCRERDQKRKEEDWLDVFGA